MRNIYLYIFIIGLIAYSCKDNTLQTLDPSETNGRIAEIANPKVTMQIPGVLKFESKEHLQDVVDRLKDDNNRDLSSKRILSLLGLSNDSSKVEFRSAMQAAQAFVSLNDANTATALADLTPEESAVINSDPECPVFDPQDYLIEDADFAAVLNENREIQVGDNLLKYTDAGIYITPATNCSELANISSTGVPSVSLSSNVTLYVPPQSSSSSSSNPTLGGTSLKLTDGTTIPASQIRDINFNNSDGNSISDVICGIFGSTCVAKNNFSSDRKMLVAFIRKIT